MFLLKKDGKVIFKGSSYFSCLNALHREAPHCSGDHAMKHEGWTIEEEDRSTLTTPDDITDWDIKDLDSSDILDMVFDKGDGYMEFLRFAGKILNAVIIFDEETTTYKLHYLKEGESVPCRRKEAKSETSNNSDI